MVFVIFIMIIAENIDHLPHGAVILTRLLTAPVSSGHTLEQASAVHLHKDQNHISTSAHTVHYMFPGIESPQKPTGVETAWLTCCTHW